MFLSTAFLLMASVAGTLWNFWVAGKIVCGILAGLLILRFFVIYHDQQHEAILSKSRLAGVVMRIFGILALSPPSIWKSSHNHHHNHNSKLRGSQIGSFPIMTKAQFLKSPQARAHQVPVYASPVDHLVRLYIRLPLRDVYLSISESSTEAL